MGVRKSAGVPPGYTVFLLATRPGALIFLRLLEGRNPPPSFPVAYRVRELRMTEGGKNYEVDMAQMWPAPAGALESVKGAAGCLIARNLWAGVH